MHVRNTATVVLWLLAALPSTAAPAEKKLTLVRPLLAQSEDGAIVPSTYQFVAGETIFFSCQVQGFTKSDKDDISLTYQVEAKDSRGRLLKEVSSGKVVATVATPEDKDWMPKIRESIIIPPLADTGEYQIVVKVKDELAGTKAETKVAFSAHGRDVAPSETLVVRSLRFLRTEEDDTPLQVAAYRPGDALWARFDMTGYKLGDANQFDIEYGLVVLRADGSVAYSEPHAAAQKNQTFYPQRYQPGVLNLNLAKDQKPGQYTIVLTVRDNLGNQTVETRAQFSVE